jgi:hypothetical protein
MAVPRNGMSETFRRAQILGCACTPCLNQTRRPPLTLTIPPRMAVLRSHKPTAFPKSAAHTLAPARLPFMAIHITLFGKGPASAATQLTMLPTGCVAWFRRRRHAIQTEIEKAAIGKSKFTRRYFLDPAFFPFARNTLKQRPDQVWRLDDLDAVGKVSCPAR